MPDAISEISSAAIANRASACRGYRSNLPSSEHRFGRLADDLNSQCLAPNTRPALRR